MSEMMDKALKSQAEAEGKSKKLGLVANTMSSGSGAGGGFGLNAPGAGPKVTHFAGGGGGRKTLDVPPDIATAWNKVLDDEQPETFLLATYSANGKALEMKCVGTGGLADFKSNLEDAAVMWGGFKCLGVDNRGSVVCKRPKFIFVQRAAGRCTATSTRATSRTRAFDARERTATRNHPRRYMPPGASVMKKAKMGTHKGAVKEALHSAHLDLTVEDKAEDLVEAELCKKLQAATGAHKPNGYEFEKDVFVADDFYGLGIGKDCKST